MWQMTLRRAGVAVMTAVMLASCSGDSDPLSTTTPTGAASPEAAVTQLKSALSRGDFDEAARMAVPDQAALASLAEGATFAEVASAIAGSDAAVASNFWSGFAQGIGDVFDSGLAVESAGTALEGETEFYLVSVIASDGGARRMVTQDIDGHQIDLFASFGAVLAGRLLSPVEILLASATEDTFVILEALNEVVPSLLVAAQEEGIPPAAVQDILQLVELISRVG